MLGVIAYVGAARPDLPSAAGTFLFELGIGGAVGVGGGAALRRLMQRVPVANESLYPLRTLAAAGAVYGVASVAHGSGFLAVFVAGVLVGEIRAPYKAEIVRFHGALAGIGDRRVRRRRPDDRSRRGLESWGAARRRRAGHRPGGGDPPGRGARAPGKGLPSSWREAVRRAVRPEGSRAGIARGVRREWSAPDADRVYSIVFVVVLSSVLVQGMTVGPVARSLAVPLRHVEAPPWRVSIRLAERPRGLRRYVVHARSRAVGTAIRDLPLSDDAWVSLIIREGVVIQPRGSTAFEPADEVVVLTASDESPALQELFTG